MKSNGFIFSEDTENFVVDLWMPTKFFNFLKKVLKRKKETRIPAGDEELIFPIGFFSRTLAICEAFSELI